jgi:hypothetical protein
MNPYIIFSTVRRRRTQVADRTSPKVLRKRRGRWQRGRKKRQQENITEKLRRWVRIRSTPVSAQTTSRFQSCNTASPQACLLSRGIHRQSFPYNFAFTPWHFISSEQTQRRKVNILPQTLQKKHMQIYISGKLVTSEVMINHPKKCAESGKLFSDQHYPPP